MRRSILFASLLFTLTTLPGVDRTATAQTLADTSPERGPRFLLASASRVSPLDVAKMPVLSRRLALELEGVTLKQALTEISRQSGLRLVYNDAVLPLGQPVHLRAEAITVTAALTDLLLGSGVDVVFRPDGQAALVKRPEPPPTGTIVGRVTDAKTQAALAGATVLVVGTNHGATTGNDGRYRIADVAPGTYTARARFIGYRPGSATVTVSADQEATADLALEKSPQRLDEVVTTGTVVPTEVKALPMPVTVIDDSFITLQRPHTIQELFRQAVPSAVAWDDPSAPYQTSLSVRGSSTLEGLTGQMKVLVDGIEAADPTSAAIDPHSIERIEVIRGPQAAAIYGSDAIGGVLQIFTKRGDPTLLRPEVEAEAALGVMQTPYAGSNSALRQTYTASVRGGGPEASYNLGAGYSHTADWVPGQPSAQSIPSVYGGMRFERGIVTAAVSGRYYVQNTPQVISPALVATGSPSYSKPFYEALENQNQTIGARIVVAPTRWWQQTLAVGLDGYGVDLVQTQPRLTTPTDTLLFLEDFHNTKTSIAFNTSIQGSLLGSVSGSLTTGFDHYSRRSFLSVASPLNISGTINVPSDQPPFLFRDITNNTGYFVQGQIGVYDALFVTGGLRAEQNTNFGDSLGTPLSPRAGVSYARAIRGTTLKLRASWGRAIRPPSAGAKAPGVSGGTVYLAAPTLGPERQHGWDAGADVVFGTRGSLSATYYDQAADNLIETVLVQADPVLTYQAQNVARVRNRGVELEGTLNFGSLDLRAQYAYTRSRVEDVGPTYTGDVRVGDQVLGTPYHTAGVSLSLTPLRGTTLATGVTYVGRQTSYDLVALTSCFAGTGPCSSDPGFRPYAVEFPGFVKVNATISRQITHAIGGFVSVDNLANNETPELRNAAPAVGRITTIGIRMHY